MFTRKKKGKEGGGDDNTQKRGDQKRRRGGGGSPAHKIYELHSLHPTPPPQKKKKKTQEFGSDGWGREGEGKTAKVFFLSFIRSDRCWQSPPLLSFFWGGRGVPEEDFPPLFLLAYPTINALLINFLLSSDAGIVLLIINRAYESAPNVQKRGCNAYIFRLSFLFCIPPLVGWWLGTLLFQKKEKR